MKALITGGTGFLGRHVVRDLLRAGESVRCLARPNSDVRMLTSLVSDGDQRRLEIIRGDLTRADDCIAAISGCDTVFHVAAQLSGAPAVLFLANVVGTRRLVEAATRRPLSRFVLISSIAVYDTAARARGSVVDEECPLDPRPYLRDPYTYSKVRQEQLAWEAYAKSELPLTVIRPGVIYGAGRECLSGRVGLRLGRLMIVMGGRRRMPYTHVENCAAAVVQAGRCTGVEGKAFNVVDDELPTPRQLVRRYQSEIGGLRSVVLPYCVVAIASRISQSYCEYSHGQLPAVLTPYKSRAMWRQFEYSNARARRALGWAPRIDLESGLKVTLEALRRERLAPGTELSGARD